MNASAIDDAGLWAVARELYEFEQLVDNPPWEHAEAATQMTYRMRAQQIGWQYAASLPLHPRGVIGEVSVGLVDAATGGPSPDCEVCGLAARGYVINPANSGQHFGCLGHLGILAGAVIAYGTVGEGVAAVGDRP